MIEKVELSHSKQGRSSISKVDEYIFICRPKEIVHDVDEKLSVIKELKPMPCNFPNVALIENSRLNFTAPQYTAYQNLFSKRQQIALMTLKNAIAELPEGTRTFFEDTLISIAHCGKYTDYRSKSQDNHCPENRLKETNLYHRFLEKLKERKEYIAAQNFDLNQLEVNSMDYRRFLRTISASVIDPEITSDQRPFSE